MMTDKKKKKPTQPETPANPQGEDEMISSVRGQANEGRTQSPTSGINMIAVSFEEYDGMQRDLESARSQAKEMSDGWARERADFQNYRRMMERDQVQQALNLKGEIIKKYLPIVDDMELALKTRPKEGEGSAWANGIELIVRKLQTILETEGVQKIAVEGEAFDPNSHQAITYEACPEIESGRIIEVVRQGYKVGERVLRPALVRVAS